jgi:hypothetical protein
MKPTVLQSKNALLQCPCASSLLCVGLR